MHTMKLYFGCCLIIHLIEQATPWASGNMKIDRMEPCSKFKRAPMTFNYIRIVQVYKGSLVSINFTYQEDLENDHMIMCKWNRCRNKDNPDTCEGYPTLKIRHMCRLLFLKHQTWTPVVEQIRPKLRCPLVKGTYVVDNATVNSQALGILPLRGWYWKGETYLMDEVDNRTLGCLYIEFEILDS